MNTRTYAMNTFFIISNSLYELSLKFMEIFLGNRIKNGGTLLAKVRLNDFSESELSFDCKMSESSQVKRNIENLRWKLKIWGSAKRKMDLPTGEWLKNWLAGFLVHLAQQNVLIFCQITWCRTYWSWKVNIDNSGKHRQSPSDAAILRQIPKTC